MPTARFSTKQRLRVLAAEVLARPPLHAFAARITRASGAPRMHELAQVGELVASASDACTSLGIAPLDAADPLLASIQALAEQRAVHATRAPFMQIERETEALLVATVRSLQPETVLEIGVADGRSSLALLEALRANGKGRLVSVDVVEGVGGLVVDHDRWDLRIHSPSTADRSLRSLLEELGQVPLVFHDGRHDYAGQMRDYQAIVPHLTEGAVFISDDVDASYAFLDLCQSLELRGVIVGELRKAIGAIRMPTSKVDAHHR